LQKKSKQQDVKDFHGKLLSRHTKKNKYVWLEKIAIAHATFKMPLKFAINVKKLLNDLSEYSVAYKWPIRAKSQ